MPTEKVKTKVYRIVKTDKKTYDFRAQSDQSAVSFYQWYKNVNKEVLMLARNGEIIFM